MFRWYRLIPLHPTFVLDALIQFQITINPANPLVVPGKTLDVMQIISAQTETPVLLIMRQPDQPIGNFRVFIRQYRLVAVACLTDAEGRAGQANTGAARRYAILAFRGQGHRLRNQS